MGLQLLVYTIVAVFVYLVLKNNLSDLRNFKIERPWYLVVSTFFFSVTVFLNSVAWHYLMVSSGEKVRLLESVDVYISSYIVRYIPGNVWGVVARSLNNREYGVNMVKTAWGWLIENVFYLLVGMLFSLLVLSVFSQLQGLTVVLAGVGFAAAIVFFLKYEIFHKLFSKVVKKILPKVKYDDSKTILLSISQRLALSGIYMISWISYSVCFLFAFRSVASFDLNQVLILVGINALAWSIGYVSIITPSGSGVREGVMILAMAKFGLSTGTEALMIALLARLTFILGDLMFFLAGKIVVMIVKKSQSSITKTR